MVSNDIYIYITRGHSHSSWLEQSPKCEKKHEEITCFFFASKSPRFTQLAYVLNDTYYTGWWLSHPSEKYKFVSWDDYSIPNWMESHKIPGLQTTNQLT